MVLRRHILSWSTLILFTWQLQAGAQQTLRRWPNPSKLFVTVQVICVQAGDTQIVSILESSFLNLPQVRADG